MFRHLCRQNSHIDCMMQREEKVIGKREVKFLENICENGRENNLNGLVFIPNVIKVHKINQTKKLVRQNC